MSEQDNKKKGSVLKTLGTLVATIGIITSLLLFLFGWISKEIASYSWKIVPFWFGGALVLFFLGMYYDRDK
jgi:hypothetical protein